MYWRYVAVKMATMAPVVLTPIILSERLAAETINYLASVRASTAPKVLFPPIADIRGMSAFDPLRTLGFAAAQAPA